MNVEISELRIDEIHFYSNLIKEVFDEFVAIDYPDEGNRTFYNFIAEDAILQRLEKGNIMVCAKIDGEIVGAHEVRDKNHIALFFVKTQHHNKGIGKELFNFSLKLIVNKYHEITVITVNSSPYALNIYKRLSFIEESEIQEKDGIKFYPMEYRIH